MKVSQLLEELEKKRKELDLAQGQFAEKLGVSRVSYNNWLNKASKPGLDTMKKMLLYYQDQTGVIKSKDDSEVFVFGPIDDPYLYNKKSGGGISDVIPEPVKTQLTKDLKGDLNAN